MKAVIQRVSFASVTVDDTLISRIGRGVVVLLGIEKGDDQAKAEWMAEKISKLRIFDDGEGKLNLSLGETNGSVLVVSQFTLAGNCEKGRRPSFDTAAAPEEAKPLYEYFCQAVEKFDLSVQTGSFQTEMKVHLVNDGPVTFILER